MPICRTKVQLAVVWRQQESAAENLCSKLQKSSLTVLVAGSVPAAILQPPGDEKKPAERTGAVVGGHKTRNAKGYYILHHEQDLSLSKDEIQ